MKRLVVVALIAFLLPAVPAGADEGNAVGVCCAWNAKLTDGDLTYKISGGDATAQGWVRAAVEEWDTELTGLTLTEVTGRVKADVNLKFKKGGGMIAGQALRKFDGAFVNQVDISISGSAFGSPNNQDIVTQVTKHEFGHALGLNHANFDGDLMSTTVQSGSGVISACDEAGVLEANHWKLVDKGIAPHAPHVNHVHC